MKYQLKNHIFRKSIGLLVLASLAMLSTTTARASITELELSCNLIPLDSGWSCCIMTIKLSRIPLGNWYLNAGNLSNSGGF